MTDRCPPGHPIRTHLPRLRAFRRAVLRALTRGSSSRCPLLQGRLTIQVWLLSTSRCKPLPPARWLRCGVRSHRARWARRGVRLWARSGASFAASQGCGRTATTYSSTTTPSSPARPLVCDFGVEVTRTFEPAGEVYATETPGGEAVVAVYRGPYEHMNEAYEAIDKWMAANQRASAGHSWEIYGDPTPDPATTETTVLHLLK
jgi:GyrI-like small molecule binding domain